MLDLLGWIVRDDGTSKGEDDVEECGYCGTSDDPNMICKDCFPK